jgi:flagellin
MSLRINQNIDAFNSYRNLSVTQGQMSKSPSSRPRKAH